MWVAQPDKEARDKYLWFGATCAIDDTERQADGCEREHRHDLHLRQFRQPDRLDGHRHESLPLHGARVRPGDLPPKSAHMLMRNLR